MTFGVPITHSSGNCSSAELLRAMAICSSSIKDQCVELHESGESGPVWHNEDHTDSTFAESLCPHINKPVVSER